MNWKTLPGLDEKLAKISLKQHKTFDGKVVEVLYGAQDEAGNPIQAEEAGKNGCGRWFGIQTDNDCQMFVWLHPASEGGAVEYGTEFKEEALEVMEEQLRTKQELCRKAETIVSSASETSEEELKQVKEQFDSLKDWNTPKDVQYKERFERACESFGQRMQYVNNNKSLKEAIVKKAEELAQSSEWKKVQAEFEKLQQEWNDIGFAGDSEHDMWKAFKDFQRSFQAKRKEYFATLDDQRKNSGDKKVELIEEAKQIFASVTNWKAATEKMEVLMEAWKKAGFAGKENDDSLWEEFNEIRRNFFVKRKEFFDERAKQLSKSINAKKELIEKATQIRDSKEYTKENADLMKKLDELWKEAGYSGKEDNDRLWETFRAIKNAFWDARHEESEKQLMEAIQRREERLKSLREELNTLEESLYATDESEEIHAIERDIRLMKERIAQIDETVTNMKNRLKPTNKES